MTNAVSFSAACERLDRFLACSGMQYSHNRNYDLGPGKHDNVSQLSPFLSRKIILPQEVIMAVSQRYGVGAASQFCQEVYWQTYWRGWLAMRPQVWRDAIEITSELDSQYQHAVNGCTGIDAFDAWVSELKDTGYLHNHARMWFASIWIHTLRLDWKLGALFFMKHLTDYDSAANTLGWRWVAGLHTKNKCYLATEENIKKYTQGRFNPVGLSTAPAIVKDQVSCEITSPLSPKPIPKRSEFSNYAWIILTDDCSVHRLFSLGKQRVLIVNPDLVKKSLNQVTSDFDQACLSYLEQEIPNADTLDQIDDFVPWIDSGASANFIWITPSTGIFSDFADQLKVKMLGNMELREFRRPWDDYYFPMARSGFFNFKKKAAIP